MNDEYLEGYSIANKRITEHAGAKTLMLEMQPIIFPNSKPSHFISKFKRMLYRKSSTRHR
jgi:hypothetical protein